MITRLTKDVTEEDLAELKSSYQSGYKFRQKVLQLLDEDRERLQKKLMSDEVVSSPNFENEALNIVSEMRIIEKMKKYLQ